MFSRGWFFGVLSVKTDRSWLVTWRLHFLVAGHLAQFLLCAALCGCLIGIV